MASAESLVHPNIEPAAGIVERLAGEALGLLKRAPALVVGSQSRRRRPVPASRGQGRLTPIQLTIGRGFRLISWKFCL